MVSGALRLIALPAAALGLCMSSGCFFIWAEPGADVLVDAAAATECPSAHFPPMEKRTKALPPERRVLLVPFYRWQLAWASERYEFFPARSFGQGESKLSYPFRLHLAMTAIVIGALFPPHPGLLAFTDDHWPAWVGGGGGTPRPSTVDYEESTRLWITHVRRFHVVFYSRGYKLDESVAAAGGLDPRSGHLVPMLRHSLPDFIAMVEWTWEITPEERLMVFRQLQDFLAQAVENADALKDALQPGDKEVLASAAALLGKAAERAERKLRDQRRAKP